MTEPTKITDARAKMEEAWGHYNDFVASEYCMAEINPQYDINQELIDKLGDRAQRLEDEYHYIYNTEWLWHNAELDCSCTDNGVQGDICSRHLEWLRAQEIPY